MLRRRGAVRSGAERDTVPGDACAEPVYLGQEGHGVPAAHTEPGRAGPTRAPAGPVPKEPDGRTDDGIDLCVHRLPVVRLPPGGDHAAAVPDELVAHRFVPLLEPVGRVGEDEPRVRARGGQRCDVRRICPPAVIEDVFPATGAAPPVPVPCGPFVGGAVTLVAAPRCSRP